MAITLVAWSVLALGQRRLRPVLPIPRAWRPGWPLALGIAVAMLSYWLARLSLHAFPSP